MLEQQPSESRIERGAQRDGQLRRGARYAAATPTIATVLAAAIVASVATIALAQAPAFVTPVVMDTTEVHLPGDYFSPAVIVVHVGNTVTWINDADGPHTVVAYPDQEVSFDIDIDAGKKGTFTFDKPGVFRYYGDDQADYDAMMMHDAKAKNGTDVYPAPMRGVIVVLDAHDGMPSSGASTIDVPDSTMIFTPFALTVEAGTKVTWTNEDDMMHMVASVPDQAAADIGPLTLVAESGSASFTFADAGVYYYYCPVHAAYHADDGLLYPLESYGMFPYVMDGLVIVTPK